MFEAVTSICKKGIDNSYYHSFILDDENNVIDFTANLIMPKEQYYLLQEVNELNCINYKEYLEEKISLFSVYLSCIEPDAVNL